MERTMDNRTIQKVMQIVSAVGLIASIGLIIAGWKAGLFTSPEAMSAFVTGLGAAGIIVFVLFQAVQVVVPILPGSLGCLVGVMMYGAWGGFALNYIGICAGSLLAFGIAKVCGRPLMHKLFSEKLINKYDHWTSEKKTFTRLLAVAIAMPVAPDDFLCYLAGTTRMKWKVFTAIILLCKPFGVAAYSLGLTVLWQQLLKLIG